MGDGIDEIKAVFGEDFGEQMKAASKIQKIKTLEVTPEAKNDIIKFIKVCWKPDTLELQYPTNNVMYHLTLAQTPNVMQVKEAKYGAWSLGFKWKSKWLYTYLKEADLKVVTASPNTYFFLIGWIKEVKSNFGKVFCNMRVDGVITLDEIKAYNDNKVSDAEATEKAIASHKGPKTRTIMAGDEVSGEKYDF